MHIPDGYLSPQTYAPLYAVMTPIWLVAARKVKETLKAKQVPLLALGAALSFIIMMFNVPMVGGSTGHAVGATLIAIVLGPWAAVIAVSLALIIQALLFGDGGITAIAANCFNMAFVMPFAGYYAYQLVAGRNPSARRRAIAGGIAGYWSLNVAAVTTAVMFGIQPLIAHGADGRPLYAPYPLSVAVPAMAIEHLLFFGVVEAVATALILGYLARMDDSLLKRTEPAPRSLKLLWTAIGALVLLTPIGALAPGGAWGEWGGDELKKMLGYAPSGMEKLGGVWHASLPEYSVPGVGNSLAGYALAGAIGVGVVALAAWLLGKFLAKRESTGPDGGGSGRTVRPGDALESRSIASARSRQKSLARKTADSITSAVAEVFADDEIASRDGALQKVDPRVKLIALLVLAVTASLVHSPLLLAALYGVGLALAALSRVDVGRIVRRVWLSVGLFSAAIALPAATSFITPGPALFALGPIPFSRPGLLGALTLILRVATSANFALLIALTTRWPEILQGLTALKVPDVFIMTLGMAQRYVVSLLRIVQHTHLAKESRTIGRFAAAEERRWVAGRMAFVVKKSVKMGDDVYAAMLSRGYDGQVRTVSPLRADAKDLLWLCGALLLSAALLSINYGVIS